jgi:biotin-(acetyl-CoA carboxylase) ligase
MRKARNITENIKNEPTNAISHSSTDVAENLTCCSPKQTRCRLLRSFRKHGLCRRRKYGTDQPQDWEENSQYAKNPVPISEGDACYREDGGDIDDEKD